MFSSFTLVSLQSVVPSNKCNSFQTWSHSSENSLPMTYSVLPALATVCFSDPLSYQPHSFLLLLHSCIYCQSSDPHFELTISFIFFPDIFLWSVPPCYLLHVVFSNHSTQKKSPQSVSNPLPYVVGGGR